MSTTDTRPAPGIGDAVRIYHRSVTNEQTADGRVALRRVRTLQTRGQWVIVRENRHGDWTVRDVATGTTHDVFRDDVEHA